MGIARLSAPPSETDSNSVDGLEQRHDGADHEGEDGGLERGHPEYEQ